MVTAATAMHFWAAVEDDDCRRRPAGALRFRQGPQRRHSVRAEQHGSRISRKHGRDRRDAVRHGVAGAIRERVQPRGHRTAIRAHPEERDAVLAVVQEFRLLGPPEDARGDSVDGRQEPATGRARPVRLVGQGGTGGEPSRLPVAYAGRTGPRPRFARASVIASARSV